MPCDTKIPEGMTLATRNLQITAALRRLEASLSGGKVRATIGPNGAIAFAGWADRDGVSDVCAYRALAAANSWTLRQAVSRAEATSGRKLNPQAVGAGVHSHDGGNTWHPGHK
jgi:hypothetical protein